MFPKAWNVLLPNLRARIHEKKAATSWSTGDQKVVLQMPPFQFQFFLEVQDCGSTLLNSKSGDMLQHQDFLTSTAVTAQNVSNMQSSARLQDSESSKPKTDPTSSLIVQPYVIASVLHNATAIEHGLSMRAAILRRKMERLR